jgi:uncharacterized protein (TIGR03067 family)
MRPHVPMILMAILLVAADTPEIDRGRLQGTWSLVMAVRDGKEIPDEEVSRTTLIINGETFAFPHGATIGTGPTGTFKVDPTQAPKAIDATPASGPDAGETRLGIYQIDGDLYNVSFAPRGEPRPLRFVSAPGGGASHSVWRRGKSGPTAVAEPDELRGTWDLVSVTHDGQKTEDAPFKGAKYAVVEGRYTVTIGEQVLRVAYKLDATTSPNAIDLTYQDETGEARMFKGIYRREGDTLTMCRPQSPEGDRPKEFTAPAGSGRVLLILKRGKP